MELYIARHGETIANAEKIVLGGGKDSPLTEKGIEQAESLRKPLENMTFDAIYSSPSNRAIDTINIALGNKYKVIIDKRLAGVGLGDMEGMKWAEADIIYPESALLLIPDPVLYVPPPNGENLSDMIKRVDSFLEDIIKMNYNKVFISTHGYVLSAIYSCITDKSISAIGKVPIYSNCEIVRYLYNCGKWESL